MLGPALAVVLAFTPAVASATVKVYESSEQATLLATYKHGACSFSGSGKTKVFHLYAETKTGWRWTVTISHWAGYDETYHFKFGSKNPGYWNLKGPGGPYSNLFAPPQTGGLGAGGITVFKDKISVGILPSGNKKGDEGVVIAGQMPC